MDKYSMEWEEMESKQMDRLKNIQNILRNDNRVAKTRISRAKVKAGYTYFYERRLLVWFKDSDLLADKSGVEDMADAIFKEQWINENRTDEQIADEIVAGWFRECLRN